MADLPLDDEGHLRLVLDYLGEELEPSILIGGWATLTRKDDASDGAARAHARARRHRLSPSPPPLGSGLDCRPAGATRAKMTAAAAPSFATRCAEASKRAPSQRQPLSPRVGCHLDAQQSLATCAEP